MANYVTVGRTSVEKVLKNLIEEMDNETLANLYSEHFDNQVISEGDGYFLTPKEEAERTGMIIVKEHS